MKLLKILFSVKFFWIIRYELLKLMGMQLISPGYIGKPCYIQGKKKIKIGKNFRSFPGIRIEVDNNALLEIGENVGISQNVHIICNKHVFIGNGVRIAAQVCITDTKHTFRHDSNFKEEAFLPSEDIVEKVSIGDNTFIGTNVIIEAGSCIGKNCVIGANSYVRGKFKDNSFILGTPARQK